MAATQEQALTIAGASTATAAIRTRPSVALAAPASDVIARSLDLTDIREVASTVPNLRIDEASVVRETLRDFFFLNFERLRERLGEVDGQLYRLDVQPDQGKSSAGVVAFQTSSARAADIFKEELAASQREKDFVFGTVPKLPGGEVSVVHETIRDFFFLNFERLRGRLADVDSKLYRLDIQPDAKGAEAGHVAFETTSPKAADIFREELKVAQRDGVFNEGAIAGTKSLGQDVSVVHETIRDFFFLNFERLRGRLAKVDRRLYQLDVAVDAGNEKAGQVGFQTTSPQAAAIFREEIQNAGRAADFADSLKTSGVK
jgi:hypothetical protein